MLFDLIAAKMLNTLVFMSMFWVRATMASLRLQAAYVFEWEVKGKQTGNDSAQD